ncbi:flagellar export chaperone FlgN [Curtobacterium sp. MCSS17_016]|uniref:flagellar export chaperone FlgN n=1 Tax=Curtobacterium sp. MCSS17_016 TaxID=2175644 RepID=UPI000DA6EF2D|nr:flagellar export chaperone FlgN [Curtobacterium sp. MCSS17_016]WIE80923.1 flagellar export chaperone FlgN [Curtobacterium sp. MCSS17_016]
MGANELSAALWRQRELLDLLHYKYETEHLLLAAGKSRWIPRATLEVEAVIEQLQTASLRTSVMMVDVAAEWGVHVDANLRAVIDAAPASVWKDIFTAHLDALTLATGNIKQLRSQNDTLMRQALRSTQELLNAIGTPAEGYDADGAAGRGFVSPALVDTEA